MKNIFDLDNLNDLTLSVTSELKLNCINEKERQIMAIFKIKSELSIDQILVGLYRKFAVERKRTWLVNRIHLMLRTEKLRKVEGKRGVYMFPRKGS